MNFTVTPPEINSLRMFIGAGPGPMLDAAAGWDGLAAELTTAAASFGSITSELADAHWQSPAATAMTAAAAPYRAWLSMAADRAQQAASQARAAVSAFEAAHAATVHPAAVAANRSRFLSLVASNLLGQNAPAIAAAEADYEHMWARDVAAMAGYHSAASAAAARLTPWLPTGTGTALLMGTAFIEPTADYVASVDRLFIAPYHPGYTAQGLYTPEQYWPLSGLHSLTIGQSVAQSAGVLDSAILAQLQQGNRVLVFGYSQSATVATLEMRHLMSLPAGQRPTPDQLSFVLAANPDRPDGGLLERFAGLYIPGLDLPFLGATPSNAYPTIDYAIQYDGQADFPQYPIDILADANAVAGMFYVHSSYLDLTPAQIASGVVQPVSPADTQTTYILIPTHNLPLLEPLRAVPVVGNPAADLLQPDLRTLVDLGYDRTAYQDIPTPAGLFPTIDPVTLAVELGQGAVQGVRDAWADVGTLGPALSLFP